MWIDEQVSATLGWVSGVCLISDKIYPRLGRIYAQNELDAVPAMDKLAVALEASAMLPVMVEATNTRFIDIYCRGQQEEE